MVFWKQLRNKTAGFTLIEVLVAITILGLVVVPIGSSLVVSYRLNARSGDTMQAQLAVSRTVETIMAEGFDPSAVADNSSTGYPARFPDVKIEHSCDRCTATVEDNDEDSTCVCGTDGCSCSSCYAAAPCTKCAEADCCAPIAIHGFTVTAKNLKTSTSDDLLPKITVTTYAREVVR